MFEVSYALFPDSLLFLFVAFADKEIKNAHGKTGT